MKVVTLPPPVPAQLSGPVPGGWWHETADPGRILCDLCPRECSLKPGDRGFCFVRQNVAGQMQLTTYGRSTGFCIDPIEKKPLNHFHPGTPVLSFGTAGCNLGCKFCQNWDISRSREVERLSELALPDMIAAAAAKTGCRSVAFTYNDPVIWAEYAIDTARACRSIGIKSVAVTAGYISLVAREPFFRSMDAANVDLKSFTEDFYYKVTYSHLQPVLDTLRWLKRETDVWFEITNLVIPGHNDQHDDLRRMCDWLLQAVGADVPVHFSAFHPDFRMLDVPRTPHDTLIAARSIALAQGLKFVYVGNVNDVDRQSTWCPGCGQLLIERNWYELGAWRLHGNRCDSCGTVIPGHFDDRPGTWGSRRQPVRISAEAPVRPAGPSAVDVRLRTTAAPSAETMASARVPSQTSLPSSEKGPTVTQGNSEGRLPDHQAPLDLTSEQEAAIHWAACEIVRAAVEHRAPVLPDPQLAGCAAGLVMGVFVTLKREDHLRGCCGMVGRPMQLLAALLESGQRTAVDDQRFPPVSAGELPYLTLDVSLLHNFQDVAEQGEERVNAIEVGRHGLKIIRGSQAGLLLPVVAVEHGWDSRTFLNQVCHKAGLPVTAWTEPDTRLIRFEGRLIEGVPGIPESGTAASQLNRSPLPDQTAVLALNTFVKANVAAQALGAVPQCFPATISDGSVQGVALRLSFPPSDQVLTFSKVVTRGGLPLQMTLLELTQSAANVLRQNRVSHQDLQRMTTDLLLLADPAIHGTVSDPDLRGLEPASRAIMVMEGSRNAWRFNCQATPEELLRSTVADARVSEPDLARILSYECRSSSDRMSNSSAAKARSGAPVRPAAVAGTFYPADAATLATLVDDCLTQTARPAEHWPAVMIPHAGLKYSGRIAGHTLQRILLPETIVIIGPKHTPHGVEWAVAPHEFWQIPGAQIRSDALLAKLLASRIEGLELDAAAHAQEHSIEVELPLLARLAPQSRVVGITIGGGSLDRCRTFARQLADVIRELPAPPLLVISSDMHHFAADAENRRLDELALAAMETGDPSQLFHVVRTNHITMCGVLPAVIVMETLLQLGQLSQIERTGYATSGDVTGDRSRVVGYAGLLMR